MKVLLPPLHVAIAASLALMAGMFSLVGFIASFISGHPAFDAGIFATLFGWGLLCGKRRLRNWMIAFSVILFFASIIPAGIITWLQISGKEPWIPQDTPRDLISAVIIAIVALYVFLVLRSPRHREWFEESVISDEQRAEERHGARFVAFPVIVVSLVLAAFAHIGKWWSNETLRGAYPVKVRIITFDEETGKELSAFTDLMPQDDGKPVKLPRYTFGNEVRNGNAFSYDSSVINGVLNRPLEFKVSASPDYEKVTVRVDRNSPGEIRVPLKRKK